MQCGAMRCTITWQCSAVMPFCGWFWYGFCGLCNFCSLANTSISGCKIVYLCTIATVTVLAYHYWVMLTSAVRALVNNPVKESFYGKRKKNN